MSHQHPCSALYIDVKILVSNNSKISQSLKKKNVRVYLLPGHSFFFNLRKEGEPSWQEGNIMIGLPVKVY